MTFDLDQTFAHIEIKKLIDLQPTDFSRQFIYDDHISRPMTHLLAKFECISLFDIWVQQFDKLKWVLTHAALTLWMYSFSFQLSYFYCVNFAESYSYLFDKLLCALIGYDLSSTF